MVWSSSLSVLNCTLYNSLNYQIQIYVVLLACQTIYTAHSVQYTGLNTCTSAPPDRKVYKSYTALPILKLKTHQTNCMCLEIWDNECRLYVLNIHLLSGNLSTRRFFMYFFFNIISVLAHTYLHCSDYRS